MSKEARKGAYAEQLAADYEANVLGDERIERRVKHGNNDRGDIAGLMFRGGRCVQEVKNCKDTRLAAWIEEAEVEMGNDDAEYCWVIHKRKGKGAKSVGEWFATMTYGMFRKMGGIEKSADMGSLSFRGKPVSAVLRRKRKMELAEWVDEAEFERILLKAEYGIAIHPRKGSVDVDDWYVTTSFLTLMAMVAGSRWHLNYTAEERANSGFMAREAGIDEWG